MVLYLIGDLTDLPVSKEEEETREDIQYRKLSTEEFP